MKQQSSGITLENDYLHFNINRNQPYSVSKSSLTDTITIQYPNPNFIENSPTFKNISRLIHHIITSKKVEGDIISLLKLKTMELYPENDIDWVNTEKFTSFYTAFQKRFDELYKSRDFETVGERAEERQEIRLRIFEELKHML